MPKADITYDTDGSQVPSREFMSMVIIMLRKCQQETGTGFISWLESFDDLANDIDSEDDNQLRAAIHKYMDKHYPPEELKK